MATRLHLLRSRLARLVSGAGTAYLLLSLFPLAFLLAAGRGWPTERSTVISIGLADGRTYDGFGLTYEGSLGALWLWCQVLLVAAAVLFSRRRGSLAKLAHAGALAWAAFLAANFWWVLQRSGSDFVAWTLPLVSVGLALVFARWRLAARAPALG